MRIWIDISDLSAWGISESYVGNAISRNAPGSWSSRPHPADGRRRQVDFDTIPDDTRKNLPSRMEVLTVLRMREASDRVPRLHGAKDQHWSGKDIDFYIAAGLTAKDSKEMSHAAAWLRLLTSIRGKRDVQALQVSGISTKGELLKAVLEILKNERPAGLDKINNLRVLQRKMSEWAKAKADDAQRLTLVHRHRRVRGRASGCQNARKVSQPVQDVIVALWLNGDSDVKMYSDDVYDKYRGFGGEYLDESTGELVDLPNVSLATIKRVLNAPAVKPLGRFVHGEKWYKDTARPYVFGRTPRFAWSLTSSDGEVAPFWLKDNRGRETWDRPTAYLIFDVHSQAIVGMHVGYRETKELLQDAFYDMLARNGRIRPMENQLDNYGKSSEGDMEGIVDTLKFTPPYNPQSKFAEPLIRAFERQVLRKFPGYIGTNITSKRATYRRNPDLARITYTLDEVRDIYATARETWNNSIPAGRKGKKTRLERLDNANPAANRMDKMTFARVLGRRTEIKLAGKRGFMPLTYQGETRTYELPNYVDLLPELPLTQKVAVRYLPHDMRQVWLYVPGDTPETDRYLTQANLAEGMARAATERQTGDGRLLRRYLDRGDALDAYTEERAASLPDVGTTELSPAAAEGIIGAGYTKKNMMQDAEASIQRALNDKAQPERKTGKKKINRWKR